MVTFQTRIVSPSTAKKGAAIEIKSIIQHIMETGYRRDDVGRPVPRDIIASYDVTYNGVEIFRCELNQGMAANPYIAFTTVATETGDLVFTWRDEKGNVTTERRKITVT